MIAEATTVRGFSEDQLQQLAERFAFTREWNYSTWEQLSNLVDKLSKEEKGAIIRKYKLKDANRSRSQTAKIISGMSAFLYNLEDAA